MATDTSEGYRNRALLELLYSSGIRAAEILGHESLDTLKHYARLTITDLKRTHHRCHPRERDQGDRES